MAKALEVRIGGNHIGYFVPPEGSVFGFMAGNVPMTYMRAQVTTGTDSESWYWQLPDIPEGEDLTLRLVDVSVEVGLPPSRIEKVSPEKREALKAAAREAARKARDGGSA